MAGSSLEETDEGGTRLVIAVRLGSYVPGGVSVSGTIKKDRVDFSISLSSFEFKAVSIAGFFQKNTAGTTVRTPEKTQAFPQP